MDISHILNELGEDRSLHYGAVSPPIYQTSNFCFPNVAEMRAALKDEMGVPFYTRGNNPTVEVLRKKVAALEGTEDCLVFGSGSAAISSAVLSQVKAGDHIVCVQKPYSWTHTLLTKMLSRFSVEFSFIDGTDPANWEAACKPNTRLFIMESPNSVTFEMQDVPAVVAIAKKRGIVTLLDNSYASPLNQNAASWGVDILCHSATKYLAGHSDTVAGVVCSSHAIIKQIFEGEFMTLGGIISPHDAWLIIRGLRTLEIRMDRVASSTAKVVAFLEQHPGVAKMYYPFSKSHPQHDLAVRDMKKGTGQFSILLNAETLEQADIFLDSLKRFLLACSWGGYESLVFPTSALYDSQNYGKTTLPWTLVRFYVGLEDPDVLIADLDNALNKMIDI